MSYYDSDRAAFLRAEAAYLREPEYPEGHVLTCALCDTAIRDCDCEETDDHSGIEFCAKCEREAEESANPCAECGVECEKCEEK